MCADCVVRWHNPPLLEIVADPVVPRAQFRSEMTVSAILQNSKISHHSETWNETLISELDVASKKSVWFG
jgi:hypothetical protein